MWSKFHETLQPNLFMKRDEMINLGWIRGSIRMALERNLGFSLPIFTVREFLTCIILTA